MKSKNQKNPPKLNLIATAWTFSGYPTPETQWHALKIFQEIRKAGFNGLQGAPGSPLGQLVRKAGMKMVAGFDVGSMKAADEKLAALKGTGVVHINVQLCDHDTPTHEALPIAIRVIENGDRFGLKPAIELHRDTCTETPEKAFALADAYQKKTGKKLRMNFDHSHPAIVKHLRPHDYWNRLGVRLDLLRMGELMHFRPFNGHHCQIPITDGKGNLSPEVKDWLPFCEKVIEAWLQTAKPGRELYVVPELGPKPGYGLSCFPDIWKDKKVLAKEIQKIWNRQIKNWKG